MSENADLWKRALDELAMQMTRATFDTWLRSSRLIERADGTWTVAVQHAFAVDWLQNRLSPVIDRTAGRIAGHPVHVVFEVAQAHEPERAEPEEAPEEPEEILQAVREERVSVAGGGHGLVWTDFYIKLKVAFRKRALAKLKGAKLSVFLCLALHVDRDGVASPGIETIMRETGYSRPAVCSALDDLVGLGLVAKRPAVYMRPDEYIVNGYAWFGQTPAPALWEVPTDKS